MGNALTTGRPRRVVMGNALTTDGTSTGATNTTQSAPPRSMAKQPKGKPYSLSDSTISSSHDSDDDELMQQTAGRRRRRESAENSASNNSTLDAIGMRYNNDTKHRKSPSTGASTTLSLVSGVLSKFITCAGTPVNSNSKDNKLDFDDCDLVEQKHRAFWELVQHILDLNDVVLMIRLLLDFLQDGLDATAAAVFLVDQSSQSMSRITRDAPTQSGLAPSRGLVGEALNSRLARFLVNFSSEEGYDPEVDLAHEFPEQKLLCVPLMEHDAVYAIIEATTAHSTRRVMDELHVKLLTWLGPILSSCMRKCIEFHDVLLSERTQKALLRIISSSDTEDTVLNLVDGVIDGVCHITNAERVSLFMIDWETDELWSLSSSYYDETLRVPLRASMMGLAATTQQTLNVRNPKADRRYNCLTDQRRGVHARCVLYVPVGNQRSLQVNESGSCRPIAVLEIINKLEDEELGGQTAGYHPGFTFDDECALEAFACEVAVILRRRSNEIEYIKLLADTRAEQVLAKRARSQVNLLECYTSYASAAHEACSRNSFSPSDRHVADCPECAATAKRNDQAKHPASATTALSLNGVSDHVEQRFGKAIGHRKQYSGRLGYECFDTIEQFSPQLLFSAPHGSRFPSWDFNVFTTDPAALPKLLEEMYVDFKVDEVLHTTKHRLQNFIVAMKEHYHPNPFHNFLHAFSVVHASYLLLSTTDAGQLLQPLDIAACLVASLGHDVDHPGHTNDFEVKSRSQLAMLYSDESVLEHHHAYTTFRLISKEKNANILQNLSSADYRHFRKMVITAILGTDMANHFKFLEAIKKVLRPSSHHVDTTAISSAKRDNSSVTAIIAVSSGAKPRLDITTANDQGKQGSEILSVLRDAVMQPEVNAVMTSLGNTTDSSPSSFHLATSAKCTPSRSSSGQSTKGGWTYNGTVEDRLFLVKTLVHASDLSGQVFPKPIALKWSNMISKEFAYQALMEQAENIPISYRNIDDPLKMVEGQLFFAQKIVSPLWDLMYIMFPDIDECMLNLRSNVAHYEQELQRLKEAQFEANLNDDQAREQSDEQERQDEERENYDRMARRGSMCGCEYEGVAVPGLARHNPAKFNSFRTIPEDDSNNEEVEASMDGESSVQASVLAAAEKSRKATRSRSSSISSSSSSDLEVDEQSLVVYE